jgi:tRNA nucleotidyltransferase (CCA-adding enzyme)
MDLFELNSYAEEIRYLHSILGNDAECFLVGGFVRDAFLGKVSTDIDIATVLRPDEIKKRLEGTGVRCIETGIRHGTVTVLINGLHIEVTTFRDPTTHDGFSKAIEVDLQYRDFTFNALAYCLKHKKLIDPLSGLADLEKKYLRACGNPAERFKEDPLRILRMVRFGYADGRNVDTSLTDAALQHGSLLQLVSVERIGDEVVKLMLTSYPEKGIRHMKELCLLPYVLPEVVPSIGFEQNRYHHQDVFEHTLSVLERIAEASRDFCKNITSSSDKEKEETLERTDKRTQRIILCLSALFHDLGKPHTLSIDEKGERHFYKHEMVSNDIVVESFQRLKLPKVYTEKVSRLVKYHMRSLEVQETGVRRILRDLESDESYELWRMLKIADKTPLQEDKDFQNIVSAFDKKVEQEKEKAAFKARYRPAINGDDLIKIGFQEGKFLGEVLTLLKECIVENPEMNTRDILLAKSREILGKIQ